MIIYQVVDDTEGLNTVLGTYDNMAAAEAHRDSRAASNLDYGDYLLIEVRAVLTAYVGD